MIDVNKWELATDEQKMQMCEAVEDNANEKAISKEDYITMFHFLLEKIKKN